MNAIVSGAGGAGYRQARLDDGAESGGTEKKNPGHSTGVFAVPLTSGRITSYNVCYTKLLRTAGPRDQVVGYGSYVVY